MIRCSNLPRVAACPGSYYATLGMKEQRSDAADEGTLLHRAAESSNLQNLDARQTSLVGRAIRQREFLVSDLMADQQYTRLTEQQIYGDKLRISGKFDECYVGTTTALLIDYKFGTWAVDDAETNLQLRGYGVLFASSRLRPETVETIHMAIIQPTVADEPQVVSYTREDLRRSYVEIDRYIRFATAGDPEPERRPSAHCRFCPAAGTARCPESVALVKAPDLPIMLEPADLGRLLKEWKRVESIGQYVEKQAKERMLAGEQIPGWGLKDNAPRAKVTDIMGAWAAMEDVMSAGQYAEACTVGLGKLEAAYREHTGCTWDEARDNVRSRLLGILTKIEVAPSLVPVKEVSGEDTTE